MNVAITNNEGEIFLLGYELYNFNNIKNPPSAELFSFIETPGLSEFKFNEKKILK